MDREPSEIRYTEADEVVNKIVGRTVTSWGLDSDGLHINLNDGNVLIVMGIVCLIQPSAQH